MPSPVHPYSDYGVALRTLRSSRGWLSFLLVSCVFWQFIGFALMYYTTHPYPSSKPSWTWPSDFEDARARMRGKPNIAPATAPATLATHPAATHPATTSSTTSAPATAPDDRFYPGTEQSNRLKIREQWDTTYSMLVPLTQLAALIAVSSQVIILFITLLVVLVAQAPGVAQLTRALIWSVLLLFMFLPWKYFIKDFPINGVIYSYVELLDLIAPVVVGEFYPYQKYIVYARFLIWPLIGLFVLLVTAERYRAGIMIAIGHPLQSMIQPRPTGGPPQPNPLGKPVSPMPPTNPEKPRV
jgi:hypothetical protein